MTFSCWTLPLTSRWLSIQCPIGFWKFLDKMGNNFVKRLKDIIIPQAHQNTNICNDNKQGIYV